MKKLNDAAFMAKQRVTKRMTRSDKDLSEMLANEQKLLSHAIDEMARENREGVKPDLKQHISITRALSTLTDAKVRYEKHLKDVGNSLTNEEAIEALIEYVLTLDKRVAARFLRDCVERLQLDEKDLDENHDAESE